MANAQAIQQIALQWYNERTKISERRNSALVIDTDERRNLIFQREFLNAHNAHTRRLIAELGIVDPTLMGALSELIANAPRLLQQTDGRGNN